MNCKSLHKKLIFYIGKDLPDKEMLEVEAHLKVCADCAAFAGDMQKTLGVVQLEKPAPVSPYFYTRLKARLKAQQEETGGRFITWERILQPALFSLLLVAGIYTGFKVGSQASERTSASVMTEMEIVPFFNELEAEPIETFLME